MRGRPAQDEAAAYYFRYIDRIGSENVMAALQEQATSAPAFLRAVSEEKSRHRYAPEKWSLRQALGHVNDSERVFQHRAWWFARGQAGTLSSFDPDSCAASGKADDTPWAGLLEEFDSVRAATLTLFRSLPEDAWMRAGTASDNPFSVRALAYIIAGHVDHHLAVMQEKYL